MSRPVVIGSDRRLKDAANALMTHVVVRQGRLELDPFIKPFLPHADSTKFALRDAQGRLLAGDAQLPVIAMGSDGTELLAMAQLDGRTVRTLTPRSDSPRWPRDADGG